jgi:endo-alpha-1,4-polygalactosaminidase (GH114 family)
MKFMAKVAHGKGMAIGLKNAIDMIPDVLGDIQFTVNEECHEQGECEEYQQVTKAGKAVFNIEYKNNPEFCVDPANVNLSTVIKPMALDTIGGQC